MRFLWLPPWTVLLVGFFQVASWFYFLKSPSLNFNHMVSVFGIISSHWCWTLWFLLLNSYYYYYYYYYKFFGIRRRVAPPFKFSTSSAWNSPLQMKVFQSKNVAFICLTQYCTREFYMSVSEFTFSCYCSVEINFLFHLSSMLFSISFSRRP